MEYEVVRYHTTSDWSHGALFQLDRGRRFLSYTCEDEPREAKVAGETCIPTGRYRLRLRQVGGFHQRYAARYRGWHRGMIEICEVPNFTDILIHCGNTDDHTEGCLLVGMTQDAGSGFMGRSRDAYEAIYPDMAEAILQGPSFISFSKMA